jgi:MFS family permease
MQQAAERYSRVSLLRLLPRSATADARRLLLARGIRGFVDGMVAVLLVSYLDHLGFSPERIGLLVTGTLLGSAALTIAAGIFGYRWTQRTILYAACAVMFCTGVGFAGLTDFWPLFVVAVIGTLNPAGGDVTVFLPTEQSLLADTAESGDRTALFARYGLVGLFCQALGALASGVPIAIARWQGWDIVDAERAGFLLYAGAAIAVAFIYAGLKGGPEGSVARKSAPLRESRSIVMRLSLLFSLDSFGSGFIAQSILLLWLYERFDVSVETAGLIFFVSGLLSASSQLAASWLAAKIGLVRTMSLTHLPAQLFLFLAAFMPTAPLAIFFMLLRMPFSAMDVPARQSYVMAMVPAVERAAASSITNVPRSLTSAIGPSIAGWMLAQTTFGWPLIIGSAIKAAYDLLLLFQFQHHHPPEEQPAAAARAGAG